MKNWKTTVIGAGAAVLYLVVSYFISHVITPNALIVAMGLAGVGATAADANTDIKVISGEVGKLPFAQNELVKTAVNAAQTEVNLLDAAHPANVLLNDLKTAIDAYNKSQQATTKK